MTNKLDENLVIFEMANNHQGAVEHGKRIISEMADIAKRQGVRAAVKLQYRELDSFIHPEVRKTESNKHVGRFLSTRLSDAQMGELVDAIRAAGLLAVVTPFDEASVDLCVAHDVDILKIASCSADDWPLLEKVAAAGRPVIVSTGGQTLKDIDNIYSFFDHRKIDFAILHCVAVYPAPPDLLNLSFIDRLRRRYPGVRIGYSGHEQPDDLSVVTAVIAKGATILERHVGVPTEAIELNAYSMNPEQTERWVIAANNARTICGDDAEKFISDNERISLLALKRGVYAARSLRKGAVMDSQHIYFAFPCEDGQLTSGEWSTGLVADRNYGHHEAIRIQRHRTDTQTVRQLIHEFRGMFNEAGIILTGGDYNIELSHHYGLPRFRETGALIVNIVNREYCKKLVALLPGQAHPSHRHMKKEETFQILSGHMSLVVNDVERQMGPGELTLVRRGDWHRFASSTGVIFEEISTQHVIGDSYYEDTSISAMDPIIRKTLLESW